MGDMQRMRSWLSVPMMIGDGSDGDDSSGGGDGYQANKPVSMSNNAAYECVLSFDVFSMEQVLKTPVDNGSRAAVAAAEAGSSSGSQQQWQQQQQQAAAAVAARGCRPNSVAVGFARKAATSLEGSTTVQTTLSRTRSPFLVICLPTSPARTCLACSLASWCSSKERGGRSSSLLSSSARSSSLSWSGFWLFTEVGCAERGGCVEGGADSGAGVRKAADAVAVGADVLASLEGPMGAAGMSSGGSRLPATP